MNSAIPVLKALAIGCVVIALGVGAWHGSRYLLSWYAADRAAQQYPVARPWLDKQFAADDGRNRLLRLWSPDKIVATYVGEIRERYAASPATAGAFGHDDGSGDPARRALERHIEARNALVELCLALPRREEWNGDCDSAAKQRVSAAFWEFYRNTSSLHDGLYINRRRGITSLVERHEVTRKVCGAHPYATKITLLAPLSYREHDYTDDQLAVHGAARLEGRYRTVTRTLQAGECATVSVGHFVNQPKVYGFARPDGSASAVVRYLQTSEAYAATWQGSDPAFGGGDYWGCEGDGSAQARWVSDVSCAGAGRRGFARLQEAPWLLLDAGVCAISPSYCPTEDRVSEERLQALFGAARDAAGPLALQVSVKGSWSNGFPYQFGAGFDDVNGALMPGVRITRRDSGRTPQGSAVNPLLAEGATILAIGGVSVYGMGDSLSKIWSHMEGGIGQAYGVAAPLALTVCPVGQTCAGGAGAQQVWVHVYFDEVFWRGRISNIQAFLAGVGYGLAGGMDAPAICAAKNAAIAAKNCVEWLRQSFSRTYVAQYTPFQDMRECTWRYEQWRMLARQLQDNAFYAGSVVGMFAPGPVAIMTRSALPARVSSSLLGRVAIEAADAAAFTASTASRLETPAESRQAMGQNVGLSAGGAVLFYGMARRR